MWDSKTRNIQLLTFQCKRSIWQNPDKTEPIRMLWFCSRLKKINNKYSWLWNTTCMMCQLWLQRYNISHHTIHILIQVPQYDTLTGKEELPRMDEPYVLSLRVQDCQLTTNWNCTCFCDSILEDMWPEARKAIQSKGGLYSPFPWSMYLITSSERAWT